MRYIFLIIIVFLSSCTKQKEPTADNSEAILFSTPKNIEYIYAPIIGQSNASEMYLHRDGTRVSGALILERTLSAATGARVISALDRNAFVTPTVNGSTIDGDSKRAVRNDRIWWYPDTNQPGAALLKTLGLMQQTKQHMEKSGTIIHTAVIWMHGENSAAEIAGMTNMEAASARHMAATSAIFDYIKSQMGNNVVFYMVLSPLLEKQAAINYGDSVTEVEKIYKGSVYTQAFQRNLAHQRTDTYLAVDTSDLHSAYDTGIVERQKDRWHFSSQSFFEIGKRLANYIARYTPNANIKNIKPSDSSHPAPWK